MHGSEWLKWTEYVATIDFVLRMCVVEMYLIDWPFSHRLEIVESSVESSTKPIMDELISRVQEAAVQMLS